MINSAFCTLELEALDAKKILALWRSEINLNNSKARIMLKNIV